MGHRSDGRARDKVMVWGDGQRLTGAPDGFCGVAALDLERLREQGVGPRGVVSETR